MNAMKRETEANVDNQTSVSLISELYRFAVQHAKASAIQQAEADDFLQEILITFMNIADRYHVTKEELKKIAKTAARNRIRDLVKSRNVRLKYHVSLEDIYADTNFDDSSLMIARDIIRRINSVIDGRVLSIFNMLNEGMTIDEISKKENISKVTVYRYINDIKDLTNINFDFNE